MANKLALSLCVASALLGLGSAVPRALMAETNKQHRKLVSGGVGDVWANPCDAGQPLASTAACDLSKSFDERVDAIVGMLAPSDKVALLVNKAGAISSLGIPAYQWWNEALHGVGRSPGVTFTDPTPYATSFPQVIATSCSFNSSLFSLIGEAVGTESRAFHNLGHAGLTFWAPNINIFRDPRWGRGHETPGEDTTLTSDYAATFPRAMQGEGAYLRVSACCKHFAAYSLELWEGVDRHHFDAVVGQQDLLDTYLPAFQTCVQIARVSGFMCSFNSVNGVPSCANAGLLTDMLRESWGFDGYVTADCDAVVDVQSGHNYTHSSDDTCVATLTAGMDSDCGTYITQYLGSCIANGACNASVTDPPLRNILKVQMRVGMFDPPSLQPYSNLGLSDINTPEHQQLALEAARQAVVLLKNENKRLPLPRASGMRLALIGPNANATLTMQANYHGTAPFLISPLTAISAFANNLEYAEGCDVFCNTTEGFAEALHIAASADVVVMVVGLSTAIEAEKLDRVNITMPGNQSQLIEEVCKAARDPIILVVMSGGAVDIGLEKSAACVSAIIWIGYPGQSGGQAIAEALFGELNPSGRLTQTFYPASFVDQVSMFDMGMRPNSSNGNPGRTHRFYTGHPVFTFGEGQSYSTFAYHWASTSQSNQTASPVLPFEQVRKQVELSVQDIKQGLVSMTSLNITVCNSPHMSGDHVLLVFASPLDSSDNGAPIQTLAAYTRLHLQTSACTDLQVNIPARAFGFTGHDGAWTTHKGFWKIQVGVPVQLSLTLELA